MNLLLVFIIWIFCFLFCWVGASWEFFSVKKVLVLGNFFRLFLGDIIIFFIIRGFWWEEDVFVIWEFFVVVMVNFKFRYFFRILVRFFFWNCSCAFRFWIVCFSCFFFCDCFFICCFVSFIFCCLIVSSFEFFFVSFFLRILFSFFFIYSFCFIDFI